MTDFLDLPLELRNIIYDYVTISTLTEGQKLKVGQRNDPGLLVASRQIRSEFLPIFTARQPLMKPIQGVSPSIAGFTETIRAFAPMIQHRTLVMMKVGPNEQCNKCQRWRLTFFLVKLRLKVRATMAPILPAAVQRIYWSVADMTMNFSRSLQATPTPPTLTGVRSVRL